MDMKNILIVNIVLFVVVALLHLWRAMSKEELIIGTLNLPVWASWIAVVVLGTLIYFNWRMLEKSKQ